MRLYTRLQIKYSLWFRFLEILKKPLACQNVCRSYDKPYYYIINYYLLCLASRVDPLTSILAVLARSCQILTTSWQPWIPWQDSY